MPSSEKMKRKRIVESESEPESETAAHTLHENNNEIDMQQTAEIEARIRSSNRLRDVTSSSKITQERERLRLAMEVARC